MNETRLNFSDLNGAAQAYLARQYAAKLQCSEVRLLRILETVNPSMLQGKDETGGTYIRLTDNALDVLKIAIREYL